jgi:hypothetical protein
MLELALRSFSTCPRKKPASFKSEISWRTLLGMTV